MLYRGAGASKGRTSWTAKAELADYISFVGFFIHYLSGLVPPSFANPPERSQSFTNSPLSPIQSAFLTPDDSFDSIDTGTVLILGGYSYGSLITTHLPSTDAILSRFAEVAKGTTEAEIRLRALSLSLQWNADHRKSKRGRSLTVEHSTHSSSHSAVIGGDESEPGTRRLSRESRRSLDVVRRSMDRSRAKLGLRAHSAEFTEAATRSEEKMDMVEMPRLHTSYLLVSPLLPPISLCATMFTKLKLHRQYRRPSGLSSNMGMSESEENLLNNPTLAVFGDKDFFTSYKKLQSWAERFHRALGSRFKFRTVAGAGHFWHEEGVEREMRSAIRNWIDEIQSNYFMVD